jgi:hypothetical protein
MGRKITQHTPWIKPLFGAKPLFAKAQVAAILPPFELAE